MPPRQRPPDRRSGDRHVLPRGCPKAPGGLLRIPQSHMTTWSLCRRLLSRGGALLSNAEVIRFLLDTASSRIEEMRAEEAAREAERAAAVEREMADVVEEDNQEARWALGLLDEGRRRVPDSTVGEDRMHDSKSSTDRVPDSQPTQPAQPVPPNPDPSIASIVDGLPWYGFISAGKLFEFFHTFQVRCPREDCA
ncbi:hypothetical protein R1sor_000125 [Riccia sorocarpa]|uniref:Uncharacterized protein n=1 Tax=Riccia sorocarpa TaxID=122646 RepID=A0ABD3GT10_9MARC